MYVYNIFSGSSSSDSDSGSSSSSSSSDSDTSKRKKKASSSTAANPGALFIKASGLANRSGELKTKTNSVGLEFR